MLFLCAELSVKATEMMLSDSDILYVVRQRRRWFIRQCKEEAAVVFKDPISYPVSAEHPRPINYPKNSIDLQKRAC